MSEEQLSEEQFHQMALDKLETGTIAPNRSQTHYTRAILLLPGAVDFEAIERDFPQFFRDKGDILQIAVDKGIDKADQLKGVDYWLGDFDSSIHLQIDSSKYSAKIPYPADKNETDTELALSLAIACGVSEVLLIGGIGGRIDHQMALLFYPFQYPSLQFYHSDGRQSFYYLQPNKCYHIPAKAGSLVSVIALTDLSGLTLTNVQWPLTDYDLPLGRGLTYSNRAITSTIEPAITAEISDGNAWLYLSIPEQDDSL
ncbi:thiamine diphosphokinase [Ignatzschineria larvae DSM 13226]|uniref:Thiamine diphosphokinase n=1 Tax=Ignatzschineria larvae DSM 13226 TaxID=1111732 RepID=A0ABZ3C1Z4_9GAMM|nr:thiamine diphosphokinase [Ignatzschineria larvae]